MARGSRWLAGFCVLALLFGAACAKKSSKSRDAEFQAIGNKAMADFNAALIDLDIGIVCAQHLEGGPEAQLYIQFGDLERVGSYETGFNHDDDNEHAWRIPNVIGVRARVSDTEAEATSQ